MNNLISTLIVIVTGIASAIIAAIIYEEFKKRHDRKPLHSILNLGRDDVLLFVFPERTDLQGGSKAEVENLERPARILPFTASEDFLAINNIKSALLKINWHGKDKIKQPNTLSETDKQQFIFSIGSTTTNSFTKRVEHMAIDADKNIFRAEKCKGSFRHQIVDGHGAIYSSETYQQVDDFLGRSGRNYALIPEQEYIDFGYFTKITNPYNSATKIFIVAGIRGIATWGVAECIKKNLLAIYNELGKKDSDSDFSAVIKIHYRNLDISNSTVVSVHKLKQSQVIH